MTMPSDDEGRPGRFDRFADRVDRAVSKSVFFAFCVGLVVAWIPTNFVLKDINTAQLIINTPTTIITFLLVSLGANTARRAWNALHVKLNAIAQALAYMLEDADGDVEAAELRKAVGLEEQEST